MSGGSNLEKIEAIWFKPSPSRGGLGGDGFDVCPSEDQTHSHPGLPLEGEGETQIRDVSSSSSMLKSAPNHETQAKS
jgi:hypothetical protein